MPRNRHRFQTPPPADPIAAARDSSLVFRLNIGFFLRQLGVFLVMDLLLLALASFGLFAYAENRCADVAALVSQRGVPTQETLAWMEASDYTITPLDREPCGETTVGSTLLFPHRQETRGDGAPGISASITPLSCPIAASPTPSQWIPPRSSPACTGREW